MFVRHVVCQTGREAARRRPTAAPLSAVAAALAMLVPAGSLGGVGGTTSAQPDRQPQGRAPRRDDVLATRAPAGRDPARGRPVGDAASSLARVRPPGEPPVTDRHRWWTTARPQRRRDRVHPSPCAAGGQALEMSAGIRGPGLPVGRFLRLPMARFVLRSCWSCRARDSPSSRRPGGVGASGVPARMPRFSGRSRARPASGSRPALHEARRDARASPAPRQPQSACTSSILAQVLEAVGDDRPSPRRRSSPGCVGVSLRTRSNAPIVTFTSGPRLGGPASRRRPRASIRNRAHARDPV